VDNVIAAIGQFPDLDFLDKDDVAKQIERTRWNSILTDDLAMATNVPGVFAAGDWRVGRGHRGGGHRHRPPGRRSIHKFLSGEEGSARPIGVTNWRRCAPFPRYPAHAQAGEQGQDA
jgi:NADPH-dependent glutamate synthase beta subunit-like oxidoreductase